VTRAFSNARLPFFRRRSKKPAARARSKATTAASVPVRCNKTVRVDGRVFGASELCALCETIEEENDDGAAIDWNSVAEKLEAREASFDALLTLRRAATRLEDEARALKLAQNSKRKQNNNNNYRDRTGPRQRQHVPPPRVPPRKRPPILQPQPEDARDGDDMAKKQHIEKNDLQVRSGENDDDGNANDDFNDAASSSSSEEEEEGNQAVEEDNSKWSGARCRVLWRWVAYGREPPATTKLQPEVPQERDQSEDDDVLDPWEFAYRARSSKAKRARFLEESAERARLALREGRSFSADTEGRPRGDSDASRLEDLTAAAMLCDDDDDKAASRDPDTTPDPDAADKEPTTTTRVAASSKNDDDVGENPTTSTTQQQPSSPRGQPTAAPYSPALAHHHLPTDERAAALAAMMAEQARQGRHFPAYPMPYPAPMPPQLPRGDFHRTVPPPFGAPPRPGHLAI